MTQAMVIRVKTRARKMILFSVFVRCEWMTLEADLVWMKEDSCRREVIQTEKNKKEAVR